MGPVYVGVIGNWICRERVSELCPQLLAFDVRRSSLVVDVYPVFGIIQVSIHARIPLQPVACRREAPDSRSAQRHTAWHPQRACARAWGGKMQVIHVFRDSLRAPDRADIAYRIFCQKKSGDVIGESRLQE